MENLALANLEAELQELYDAQEQAIEDGDQGYAEELSRDIDKIIAKMNKLWEKIK